MSSSAPITCKYIVRGGSGGHGMGWVDRLGTGEFPLLMAAPAAASCPSRMVEHGHQTCWGSELLLMARAG